MVVKYKSVIDDYSDVTPKKPKLPRKPQSLTKRIATSQKTLDQLPERPNFSNHYAKLSTKSVSKLEKLETPKFQVENVSEQREGHLEMLQRLRKEKMDRKILQEKRIKAEEER